MKKHFGVLFFVLALAVLYVGVVSGCGGGSGSGSGGSGGGGQTTYYTVTLQLVGTTGTLSTTSVAAGGTVSVTGVGVTSGYQLPITATNCTLSSTTCASGAINANTTISLTATVMSTAYTPVWLKVSPSAVFDSDYANAQITIWVSASGTGFQLEAIPTQALASGYDPIPLQDTHTTANGGEVYSAIATAGASSPTLRYYGKTADTLGFIILAVDANGNVLQPTSTVSSSVEMGIVSKSKQVNATQTADGVFVTPNAVNIVQAYSGPLNASVLTKQLYALYSDVFDTIVLSSSRVDVVCSPCHGSTQYNTVLGIGSGGIGGDSVSPPWSGDSYYGSNGFLKGITWESPVDAIHKAFLHEFGHTFAFYLSNSALDLTRGSGVHQNALGTSVGWLGNNQYMVPQTDGDFLVVSKANGEYSDLELYLMGLEPASAVPDGYFVLSSNYVNLEMVGLTMPASATTFVTMSDIVGVYGQRSPTFNNSQKSFRALFVWMSEQQPTVAELALHDDIAAFYASSAVGEVNTNVFPPLPDAFNAATKGNGTLVVAVPQK
jgi:hypothetical protein